MSSRRRQIGSPLTLFAFQDIITATTGILILITLILCLSITKLPENASPVAVDLEKLNSESEHLNLTVSRLKADLEIAQRQIQTFISISPDQVEAQIKASEANLARLQSIAVEQELELKRLQLEQVAQSDKVKKLASENDHLREIQDELIQVTTELDQLRKSNRIVYNFKQVGNQVPWMLEVAADRLVVARSGKREPPLEFSQGSERTRLREFKKWLDRLPQDDRYFVTLIRPSGVKIFEAMGGQSGVRPILEKSGAVVGIDLIDESRIVIDPLKGAAF